jgi:5-methylthioadenosine/S-adenosylhomocysteine deaminase
VAATANLALENGLIVTMDKQRRIIERGTIFVENDKIVRIEKAGKSKIREKAEKVIDAQGMIMMPGLICAHTHLYGELLRGASLNIEPPTNFTQILQRVWWPMDETMTSREAYTSSLIGCLEFLKSGTTCFADTFSGPNAIHQSLDHIARAVKQVGIRGILSYEATERHGAEEGEKGVEENIRFIEKVKRERENKIGGMFSIHASFTVSDQLMKDVDELADKYKVPITIHASEGLVDLHHNLEKYGKRTIERLNHVGLLGPNSVLAHCVQVNDDEIELVKRTGAKVAHNPMSNMLNAVGVAPIVRMLEKNIPVGLGNDGYVFDGFENIRTTFLIHKVHHLDPRVMDMQAVLEMATIRGAELYGLENEIGSLEVGKKADIVMIKPDIIPTPLTQRSVSGHIVNAICGKDVHTVIVDGQIVMENRKILTTDETAAIKVSQEAAEKFVKRLKNANTQVDYLKAD